jgi:hypothetical protein
MKKILLTVLLPFVFFSCNPLSDNNNNDDDQTTRKFWAQNTSTREFYRINADRLANNNLCEVWAEEGSGVTEETAQKVAGFYSDNIYHKMLDAYGWTLNIGGTDMNTMEWADTLVGGNGKLTILLLDIKDGYGSEESGYVSGYFFDSDLFSDDTVKLYGGNRSNERAMIYMDVVQGKAGSNEFYGTLAHEMQHLINYVTSELFYKNKLKTGLTDTWIDEGLSESTYWVIFGEHNKDRLNWYNLTPTPEYQALGYKSKIAEGNNFYIWGNHTTPSNADPLLDDYATVYIFFQWLRLQTGGTHIYRDIVKSHHYNYMAITEHLTYNHAPMTWEKLLETWFAANFIKHPSNEHGYKNDPVLGQLRHHYFYKTGSASTPLYSGEGVYSYYSADGIALPLDSGHIKYIGLDPNTGDIYTGTSEASTALLTYNANTYIKRTATQAPETSLPGTVTNTHGPSSSIQVVRFSNRYPISMGDMLMLKGAAPNPIVPAASISGERGAPRSVKPMPVLIIGPDAQKQRYNIGN